MTDQVAVMRDGAAVHHGKTADLDKAKLIEHDHRLAVIAVEKRSAALDHRPRAPS